ncbi:MAG: glycoside hydrolase family 9 protein [Bacilli bacterium]
MFNNRIGYLKEDYKKGAEHRWLNKVAKSEMVLNDFRSLDNLVFSGLGNMKLSKFNNEKIVCITTNTDIEHIKPRPTTNLRVYLNGVDLSSYNRISINVYPKSVGHHNFYFHFTLGSNAESRLHAPSLIPNQWNQVVFELDNYNKTHVNFLSITPFLMGCPMDALPEVDFYFKDLVAQEVDEDYVLGWDLNSRLSYCHAGYLMGKRKVALTQTYNGEMFSVLDCNNKEVYVNRVTKVDKDLGSFLILDFSEFNNEGNYRLIYGDLITDDFSISDDSYTSSTIKSLNFLRQLRCGYDISGVHNECHLGHFSMHPDGRVLPSHGGWHDAGDVSQYEICTAEMAHALLDLALVYEKKDERVYLEILDEAKWGLNWLLRTRFKDGYRALAVHYSIWRSQIIDPNELFKDESIFTNNISEVGPFENFIASSAEAVGYSVFKEIDPVFAQWSKRCAIADFNFGLEAYVNNVFTKRWGPGPDVQVVGSLVIAGAILYEITGEDKYLKTITEYAKKIVLSQETNYIGTSRIRGFFYEDVEKKHILTYEHRGHEQTPIQALVKLCEIAKDHEDYDLWINSIKLYKEYITNSLFVTEPYNLLPAQVYKFDMLNYERFTVPRNYLSKDEVRASFNNQIENGYPLGNDYYLRRLPIAIQRRGFHATLLSKAKAVSLIGKFLNDENLIQLAIDQLEWILGKNPFSSSTMYGEGNNYHPLYVAFSQQMVGALPVGIKTLENDDKPYWPVINNAVFKEIWGHTTGKYLWVLADIL